MRAADLLLHVFDVSDSPAEIARKQAVVQKILQDLQADTTPQLLVANKIDLKKLRSAGIKVSAVTGANLEKLVAAIERKLF